MKKDEAEYFQLMVKYLTGFYPGREDNEASEYSGSRIYAELGKTGTFTFAAILPMPNK